MEEQCLQEAPKALEAPEAPNAPKTCITNFVTIWFYPLVHTINNYVQEPGREHLTSHIPDPKASFAYFEEEVKKITTIKQLKEFERTLFRFICTINDKYVSDLWNESIERMSKFVVEYRIGEHRFQIYAFYKPRYLLIHTCLGTMLSIQLGEDVKAELEQLYSDLSFTAPEHDERVNEHLRTLHVLITTKCADTELAVLYTQFCQDLESVTRVYREGF
jgi:hypothetical protein